MLTYTLMHIALGAAANKNARPAEPLRTDPTQVPLAARMRQSLLDSPLMFLAEAEVGGHPKIWAQWGALCQTAGVAVLRSGSARPDAYLLLMAGLETADELDQIRRSTGMFAAHWPKIAEQDRPLAVCGYLSPARMADAGVATVLEALCHAFFNQFGEEE